MHITLIIDKAAQKRPKNFFVTKNKNPSPKKVIGPDNGDPTKDIFSTAKWINNISLQYWLSGIGGGNDDTK